MFHPSASISASQELADFIHGICPVDAHILVTMRGVWVDGNAESFRGQFMPTETTRQSVVRAFTYAGRTYWTLEKWEHDNGYRCELVVLSKAEFLALVA
mgnify:CR=1 FL=1